MKGWFSPRRLAIGILGLIVIIQLFPAWRWQTNPAPVAQPRWDSPQTQALAQRACFDCHSNQTSWRWYTYVAPVSWLTAHDVEEGRGELNFSEWGMGRRSPAKLAREIEEQINEGEMPPTTYTAVHPSARLTDAEKATLIAGIKKLAAESSTTGSTGTDQPADKDDDDD